MNKKLKLILFIFSVLLIVGLIALYFNQDNKNSPKRNISSNPEQVGKDFRLNIVSGMIYRHLVGYSLVCKEAGQPLQKYPVYFSQKYKQAIQKINEKWENKGTTLEDILIHYDVEIYPNISQDIKKELIDIERLTAKYILAHQNNVSVDKIEWTPELEKKLNLKDACLLLDDEAAFFLDQSTFDKEFTSQIRSID